MATVSEIKQIEGYEDYFVSNTGKVFSKNRELRQYEIGGHLCVYLYKNTIREKIYVHRLVAKAFIPNPNNYPIVNHKDENGLNNDYKNLEWCTYSYNTTYGTCISRRANNCKKKVVQMDMSGNVINVFNGIIDAATTLRIDASSLSKAALGKRRSAGGYMWKYDG